MSDDRIWLRHKPSGRVILLAKWWTPRAATYHTAECMERWLNEVLGETYEQTLPLDLFDVVTEGSSERFEADWRCECAAKRQAEREAEDARGRLLFAPFKQLPGPCNCGRGVMAEVAGNEYRCEECRLEVEVVPKPSDATQPR